MIWTLLGILTLVVILVAAIWIQPTAILNPFTLKHAAQYASSHGVGVKADWKNLEVDIESAGFLKKRFNFDWTGLCVDTSSIDGCFNRAELSFRINLKRFPNVLEDVGPVDVNGLLAIHARSGEEKPAEKAKAHSDSPTKSEGWVPSFIAETRFHDIEVHLSRWSFEPDSGSALSGKLDLSTASENDRLGWKLALTEKSHRADLLLHLLGSQPTLGGLQHLWLEGHAEPTLAGKRSRIALETDLQQTGSTSAGYQIRARFNQGAKKIAARVRGSISESRIRGVLDAESSRWISPVREARVMNCRFDHARDSGERDTGTLKLDCPIGVTLADFSKNQLPNVKMPERIGMNLHTDLHTSFPISPEENVKGLVQVVLDPILTPLFDGEGQVSAQVDGVPSEFPRKFRMETDLGLKLRIPVFQRLVSALERSDYAVPAPLNDLKGSMEFGTTGKLDLEHGKFPVYFNTRLGSRTQSLHMDAAGDFQFERATGESLGMKLTLNDVQIVLPRLDLEAPPRFAPDPRIDVKPRVMAGQKAAGRPFHYDFRVVTAPGKAIRLISNRAKAPIPIHLDLSFRDGQAMAGTVHVTSFPLELFNRDVQMDHFDLTFDPAVEAAAVDGMVKVQYTDYTIQMLVLGDTEKPRVILQSDPPLSEDQITAVLFFGQTPDELDPDQSESAGHIQAGLANRAIGLASLYFLSSTPIQSVGYNSATGTFYAKVKLAQGTSLNVGSDSKQLDEVSVRKRLGPRWAVTTGLTKFGDAVQPLFSAFLEWTNRY